MTRAHPSARKATGAYLSSPLPRGQRDGAFRGLDELARIDAIGFPLVDVGRPRPPSKQPHYLEVSTHHAAQVRLGLIAGSRAYEAALQGPQGRHWRHVARTLPGKSARGTRRAGAAGQAACVDVERVVQPR